MSPNKNIFRFKTDHSAPSSPFAAAGNDGGVFAEVSTPPKVPRKIPKTPHKVLDSPSLQDDFYLNLVDWSSQNMLAVGLGTCVYLWSASTSKICQRLMAQGLPGMTTYSGPFDVVRQVRKTEGFRGLYRGLGITILTHSPANALWWGAYGAAQHAIWRGLGYGHDPEKKPSNWELVTVQATAGAVAGACSSLITAPIDTVKTRLQERSLINKLNHENQLERTMKDNLLSQVLGKDKPRRIRMLGLGPTLSTNWK